MKNELKELRELAKVYAEYAFSDKNIQTPDQYRQLNSLKMVRPPVLVFEVPWGEMAYDDELRIRSESPLYRGIENAIRRDIFQFKYFGGDYAVHPYYMVKTRVIDRGMGLNVKENVISSTTGAYIAAHEYHDILPDEEALEMIQDPYLEIDEEATNRALEAAHEVFDGIMEVKRGGVQAYFAMWDEIPRFHGVTNSLMDLSDRPEFVHKLIDKFTTYKEKHLDLYEKLNILETDPYYLHCTPACTYELPIKDMDKEKIGAKDVWGRGMAQIFSTVSPQMHYDFDIKYMKRLFDRCGLTYYGCCEPLDRKIHILKEFSNLRRISITPWADVNIASEAMGRDYVLSAKSNPAFVSQTNFDKKPVIEETKKIIEACKKNNTPFEFILKDISTIANKRDNLTKWVETVNQTITNYWG